MSPTQRALAYCKKQGWTAYITERWNSFAKIRQDLLGFADLVVLDGRGGGPLAVQVTTTAHMRERERKIDAEPRAHLWLKSPARIEVWGFSKQGGRGKRKLWEITRRQVRLPMTDGTTLTVLDL